MKKLIADPRSNKRKRLLALARFLVFAVAMSLLLIALNAVLAKIPATGYLLEQAHQGTISASLLLALDGAGFLLVLFLSILSARVERRPFSEYGLPLGEAFQKRFWQGVAWGLLLASVDIAITHLLGGFSFGTLALSVKDAVAYGLAWSIAFVFVGLCEEFLYRGYALYTLGIGLGFWPASILLSALFAGLHLMNTGESAVGALDVMLYSLFACFTLRRLGSLWFAVGLHAAWNFSLTFVYSVPGSGVQARGHLFHSTLKGPIWLTGGSVGPEGSAAGMAVLLASFCLFPILFRTLRRVAGEPSSVT